MACYLFKLYFSLLPLSNDHKDSYSLYYFVVLSACETGIGKLAEGEDLLALTRGLMYSGTPNIVFSLWHVPDKATKDVMITFYKYVPNGKEYPEALRLAKLEIIQNEKYAFPLYWGGMMIVGR